MANTFQLIAATTIDNTSPTSFSFTNIPQTYDDLYVMWSGRENIHNGHLFAKMTINTTLGNTDHYGLYYYGGGDSGSSSASGNLVATGLNYGTAGMWNANGSTANFWSSNGTYLSNYTSSYPKTFSTEGYGGNNSTGSYSAALTQSSYTWSPGSPTGITSLYFWSYQGTYAIYQYSTFYLYGIKNT